MFRSVLPPDQLFRSLHKHNGSCGNYSSIVAEYRYIFIFVARSYILSCRTSINVSGNTFLAFHHIPIRLSTSSFGRAVTGFSDQYLPGNDEGRAIVQAVVRRLPTASA